MKCPSCENEIPFHIRNCPICHGDVGFPNVRAAQQEKEALEERYNGARESAKVRGSRKTVQLFDNALGASRAVLCRGLRAIIGFLESDNELYTSFYKQVSQASRLAEYNKWDVGRESVDSTLFPLYRDEIVCAALSLSDIGARYYGNCHLVLSSDLIGRRATVFEENPFMFCKRHSVIAGQELPRGYRATWTDRHKLGVAKLHHKLDATTNTKEFPDILLEQSSEPDFIEVHIYGGIHRKAIDKITFVGLSGPEQVLVEGINKGLRNVGVEIEEMERH